MVEAVITPEETTQKQYFTVPDPTNHHHTLNMCHPYGRYRNRLFRKSKYGLRTIGPSDAALGTEKEVVTPQWAPEESVKRIE